MCVHMCMHVYLYVYRCLYVYVFACAYMYVCRYVHMYLCVEDEYVVYIFIIQVEDSIRQAIEPEKTQK